MGDPQTPVGRFTCGGDLLDEVIERKRERLERLAVPASESSGGAHPHAPVGILEDALHRVRRQTIAPRVPHRHAVIEPNDSGLVGSDPQRVPAIFEQRRHPHVAERDAVHADGRETHAVERDETLLCAEPQSTVGRLGDRVNRRLRQPLLHLPDAMHVLRQRACLVQRVGRRHTGAHERRERAQQQ